MEKNRELNINEWVDDRLRTLAPSSDWQPNSGRGLDRLRDRSNTTRVHAQRWVWATAAAAVALTCLLVFPATRAFAERCVNTCVAETTRVSTMLWRTAPGKTSDQRLAPDFTLRDANGTNVRLSDFKGKVVLLNFWATWCAPCKLEIPWFIEFQRSYADQGLVVLGVSMDEDGWTAVKPFIDRQKINYRVMVADSSIAQAYDGLDSLPTTLVIDRSGRVLATHVGLISKKNYESEIKAALNQ